MRVGASIRPQAYCGLRMRIWHCVKTGPDSAPRAPIQNFMVWATGEVRLAQGVPADVLPPSARNGIWWKVLVFGAVKLPSPLALL